MKTKWGDYVREYGMLDVEGRVIFDLGADYGTTAEFFLGKGAARVFASEKRQSFRDRLAAYADEEPRLCLLPPLESPEQYAEWIAQHQPYSVKSDIEGAERHILAAADDAFCGPVEYSMETHGDEMHEAMLARCERHGYRVTITRTFANPHTRVLHATRAPE